MPTLQFKGKEYIYSHHLSVPFRPLKVDASKSLPPKDSVARLDDNLIIHGDNLEALKALLPVYAGKVDCIYIDPPYNTGTEGWCYNDKVNSPLMKEWLKKASNPVDLEDMERHDKWLCMMWARLQLLKELLAETGVIFISIDDNEQANLKLMMDEIFKEENFIANICWQKKQSPQNDATNFSDMHDFIIVYAKNKKTSSSTDSVWIRNLLPKNDEQLARYKNYDNDLRGDWASGDLTSNKTKFERPNLFYSIVNPITNQDVLPPESRVWRYEYQYMDRLLKEERIFWGKEGQNFPRLKNFITDVQEGIVPTTWWNRDFVGDNQEARREFRTIFGEVEDDFSTPKPSSLIKKILQIAANQDSLILDSFAGSGTTAQAVLELNQQDGGNRKFILIECENYADTITAERVRRVMQGYEFTGTDSQELLNEKITFSQLKNADELLKKVELIEFQQSDKFDKISKTVKNGALIVTGETKVTEKKAGLGGSFTYATLGEPLNIENMLSGKLPSFAELAGYVFYTATGLSLNESVIHPEQFYIGESTTHRLYLIYQATADFLRSEDAALNTEKLKHILQHHRQQAEKKQCLIFAAAKFMSQNELLKNDVVFCQLPYAIHRLEGGN